MLLLSQGEAHALAGIADHRAADQAVGGKSGDVEYLILIEAFRGAGRPAENATRPIWVDVIRELPRPDEHWVDAVSDSVRNYLGLRFGFHGLESTTDEIAAELGQAETLMIEPNDAIGFLGQCDLVKFAKASLADEASQELIAEAFALVDRTRPTTSADARGQS